MVAIFADIAKNRATKLTDAISVRKFQPRSNLNQNPNQAPNHGHSTSFINSAETPLEGFPGKLPGKLLHGTVRTPPILSGRIIIMVTNPTYRPSVFEDNSVRKSSF